MAELVIIYWRDIPAQLTAKQGRQRVKRELPVRFIEAIDRAAMASGARDSDTYLAQWRHGDPAQCEDDLEAAVVAATARIESEYDDSHLARLVGTGGRET